MIETGTLLDALQYVFDACARLKCRDDVILDDETALELESIENIVGAALAQQNGE